MEKNKKIIIGVVIGIVVIVALILLLNSCTKKEKEYTVTFINSVDDTTISTVTVKENEKVDKPSDPKEEGYIFDNWYYNDKIYDFETKVTEDMIIEARFNKEVNEIEESIELSGITLEIEIDETKGIDITKLPEGILRSDLVWETSDEDIVTVDEKGNIKGLKEGKVTITVKTKDEKYRAKCEVTVKKKTTSQGNSSNSGGNTSSGNKKPSSKAKEVVPTKVSISGSSEVYVGNSITLQASISPNNVTNKKVTWSSSNDNVARVDQSGKVTGVSEGQVTITVTTSNGKTATHKVEVKSIYKITLTANKSETGSIRDYTITSVLKDGKEFKDFITFTYNNQVRKPEHIGRVISADYVNSSIKTASIVLKNGKTVTATVEIK